MCEVWRLSNCGFFICFVVLSEIIVYRYFLKRWLSYAGAWGFGLSVVMNHGSLRFGLTEC